MKKVEEVKQELRKTIKILDRLIEVDSDNKQEHLKVKGQAEFHLTNTLHPADFKIEVDKFERKCGEYLKKSYDLVFENRRIKLKELSNVSGTGKLSSELGALDEEIRLLLSKRYYCLDNNEVFDKLLDAVDAKIEEARKAHEEYN